ncbi:Lysophospholipase L1 [Amycolatopsis xylanica]|uniref:Lysophospholipase L1 n=1 Tax=Amycolatopsis xylanica TaxID=589385 RepID=A0A1H2ZKP4_9PSEU|nr:SGNH/GDSL hydrolase family protein [Amycolatopsis xylanica]SDX17279.1 Lysophospholipase L1 [Amycolatopsis xylanica]
MRGLLTVALAPVLLAQALHVRRVTPRLPGASGPVTGSVPGGDPLRLLVLGESTVDGVGAATHEEALTGQLALALAERTGRGVRWQAVGRTGANARVVRTDLLPAAEPADLVVIALGVNDTIELHSAARYRRDLLRLVVAIRRGLGPVPVLLAGVPPMDRFPVLPRPLRAVLGARSAALDAAAVRLTRVPGVGHAPMPSEILADDLFAADGFHPGPAGYRKWAAQLAQTVTAG